MLNVRVAVALEGCSLDLVSLHLQPWPPDKDYNTNFYCHTFSTIF